MTYRQLLLIVVLACAAAWTGSWFRGAPERGVGDVPAEGISAQRNAVASGSSSRPMPALPRPVSAVPPGQALTGIPIAQEDYDTESAADGSTLLVLRARTTDAGPPVVAVLPPELQPGEFAVAADGAGVRLLWPPAEAAPVPPPAVLLPPNLQAADVLISDQDGTAEIMAPPAQEQAGARPQMFHRPSGLPPAMVETAVEDGQVQLLGTPAAVTPAQLPPLFVPPPGIQPDQIEVSATAGAVEIR